MYKFHYYCTIFTHTHIYATVFPSLSCTYRNMTISTSCKRSTENKGMNE